MAITKEQSTQTAIARFRTIAQVGVNTSAVYATYTSGPFNKFYASEEEAIAHCSNPERGAHFNRQWFQDRYEVFNPGELFAADGNESVYISSDRSSCLDAIGGRWEMKFVEWEIESPLAA
jgi:hypothetical protein